MDTPVRKYIAEDKKDLEKLLKEEARKAQLLICFLDGDREGENISFEVIDVCREANPRIAVILLRRRPFFLLLLVVLIRVLTWLLSSLSHSLCRSSVHTFQR